MGRSEGVAQEEPPGHTVQFADPLQHDETGGVERGNGWCVVSRGVERGWELRVVPWQLKRGS